MEPSFDDLYNSLQEKQKCNHTTGDNGSVEQQYTWYESLRDLEKQIKEEEDLLELYPKFHETCDSIRDRLLDGFKEKWDS